MPWPTYGEGGEEGRGEGGGGEGGGGEGEGGGGEGDLVTPRTVIVDQYVHPFTLLLATRFTRVF